MEIIYAIHIFFLGAIFSSFLNLAVYRIENEYPVSEIIKGRSVCENCKKVLPWYELMPIFSFLFLRGRCSKCNSKIHISNIILEFILGSTFVLFFVFRFEIISFVFLLVLYFWFVYDFKYKSIPKKITDIILVMSFVYWLIFLIYQFDLSKIYPVIISLALLLIIYIASFWKKLFGIGDMLVIVALSFWLDMQLFVSTLLYSIIVGGVFSIFLVLKDKNYMKKYIPFLPFIFFGFIIAMLLNLTEFRLFDYMFTLW